MEITILNDDGMNYTCCGVAVILVKLEDTFVFTTRDDWNTNDSARTLQSLGPFSSRSVASS